MSGIPWTNEEKSILKLRYGKMRVKELCKLLPSRTVNAIQAKAITLGLSRFYFVCNVREIARRAANCLAPGMNVQVAIENGEPTFVSRRIGQHMPNSQSVVGVYSQGTKAHHIEQDIRHALKEMSQ